MKDAWPVKAQAVGGRHYRGDYIDQNFDTYSVEYTFADGTKLLPGRPDHDRLPPGVRQLRPRHQGLGGHLGQRSHAGAQCRIYKGQNLDPRQPRLGVPAARAATRTSSSGTT